MNTQNQITDLLKITGRLIGVLEREIEVLRAMQPAEIEALIGKFQSTLAANERALRATRDTSQRVLEAIAHEIDRKRRENAGYSAGGYAAAASNSHSGQPVSIAIDERF